MSRIDEASAIYLGEQLVTAVYRGSVLVWEGTPATDPDYGNGVYGPPIPITTSNGGGVNVITESRKRISVDHTLLENDPQGYGYPYRIDFDIEASNGAILEVDWCDMSPKFSQVVEAGKHYGHESVGRVGGYSSTYRFADFQCAAPGGSVTINNLMVRRIFEFSS